MHVSDLSVKLSNGGGAIAITAAVRHAGALSVLPAASMQHTSFDSVAAEEPMAPLTPPKKLSW